MIRDGCGGSGGGLGCGNDGSIKPKKHGWSARRVATSLYTPNCSRSFNAFSCSARSLSALSLAGSTGTEGADATEREGGLVSGLVGLVAVGAEVSLGAEGCGREGGGFAAGDDGVVDGGSEGGARAVADVAGGGKSEKSSSSLWVDVPIVWGELEGPSDGCSDCIREFMVRSAKDTSLSLAKTQTLITRDRLV